MKIFKSAETNNVGSNEQSSDITPPQNPDAGAAYRSLKNKQNKDNTSQEQIKFNQKSEQLQQIAGQWLINDKKIANANGSLKLSKDLIESMKSSSNVTMPSLVFTGFCDIAKLIKIDVFFGKNDIDNQYKVVLNRVNTYISLFAQQINITEQLQSIYETFASDPANTESGKFKFQLPQNFQNVMKTIPGQNTQPAPTGGNQSSELFAVQGFETYKDSLKNTSEQFQNSQVDLMKTQRLTTLSGVFQDLQNLCLSMCPIEQKYDRFKKRFGSGIPSDLLYQLDGAYDQVKNYYEQMENMIQPGTFAGQPVGEDQVDQIKKAFNTTFETIKNKQAELENDFISGYFGVKV
jgi:hypothetical protein